MIGPAVLAGMGDKGSETLEEGKGVEDEGAGSVAPNRRGGDGGGST